MPCLKRWGNPLAKKKLHQKKSTPLKIKIEPKNHPIEKENHLPNLLFLVPCSFSGVYSPCQLELDFCDWIGIEQFHTSTKTTPKRTRCLELPRCLTHTTQNHLSEIQATLMGFFSCSLNWVSIKSTKNISQKSSFSVGNLPTKNTPSIHQLPIILPHLMASSTVLALACAKAFRSSDTKGWSWSTCGSGFPVMSVIVVGQGFLYMKKQVWKPKNEQPPTLRLIWGLQPFETWRIGLIKAKGGNVKAFFSCNTHERKGPMPRFETKKTWFSQTLLCCQTHWWFWAKEFLPVKRWGSLRLGSSSTNHWIGMFCWT